MRTWPGRVALFAIMMRRRLFRLPFAQVFAILHTNFTPTRSFLLRPPAAAIIVAPNWAQAFRVPLSRLCAMTPRDNAITAAPAVRPDAAIGNALLLALEMAHVEARRRPGQFDHCVRLVRTIRGDHVARQPPLSVLATSAPRALRASVRLPVRSPRATIAEPASTDAGAVPQSATRGWLAPGSHCGLPD